MANSVYRKTELVGTSANSITEAIDSAVAAASSAERITWFEVTEIRGHVEDGKVTQYQVVLKAGSRVDV